MSAIVLAFACFPLLAHAECTSSSCIQYTEDLPEAGGGGTPMHHKQNQAKASKSGGGDAGQAESAKHGSDGPEGSDSGESQQGGMAVGGHSQGGPPQGKAAGSPNGKPGGSPHSGGQMSVKPTSSSDGGSSPLVPILILIAVLAAISVGTVMYRQRRGRHGPSASASPEAS
jgi:cobalamin biosynthesis Mg chelatase CobN